jgi:hypothetical protein
MRGGMTPASPVAPPPGEDSAPALGKQVEIFLAPPFYGALKELN